ncbi:hypothetical protein [Shewanella sp.]|uniref:hypothetical protein n=1 Tax=Shewanella sp. TaxID=50422 RepID=UPI0040546745
MIKKSLSIIGLSVTLTACTSSGVSWDALEKAQNKTNYCSSTFPDALQAEACEVESIALVKAKTECVKDSNPSYCLLMAKYSWNNFKDVVLKSPPTRAHAKLYPVMCGIKDKAPILCSKI